MKVLLLCNNWTGWQAAGWLRQQGESVIGLVVHPETRRKFGKEILEACGLPAERVFDGASLREPKTLEALRALAPDIGVSVYFGYILRPELLSLFPRGCINLHPAYLPFNRGAYPNIWSIVDGTPAGTTLHYVDPGVDTGDIIEQMKVECEPIDTGATLNGKLERASLSLFQKAWPKIRAGQASRKPQENGGGTVHKVKDVAFIDEIKLDEQYTARRLIDVMRARTFPPYDGAYFVENGRKVFVRLQLEYEKERAK